MSNKTVILLSLLLLPAILPAESASFEHGGPHPHRHHHGEHLNHNHTRHHRNIPNLFSHFRPPMVPEEEMPEEPPPHLSPAQNLLDSEEDDDSDDHFDFPLERDRDESENSATKCATCKSPGVKMTEEELTALRIEFVKNQILKKLRLTERPRVSIRDLPNPIAEGFMQPDPGADQLNRQLDDYYAKTTQKIIFMQEASDQCNGLKDSEPQRTCLKFSIPADVEVEDVASAQLWLYKKPDVMDYTHQSFVVSDVTHWDKQRSFPKAAPIAIADTHVAEGWMKVDLTFAMKNWFQYHELQHIISITCNTCGARAPESPICTRNRRKPFIVIDTYSQRKRRQKRASMNCEEGRSECCRDQLYVSFKDIGWDDWIIHPLGYHAFFCRGSCASAATIRLGGSDHMNLLRNMINNKKDRKGAKSLELVPCCAATQYSSLQLFYLDSNNTATMKTLPNMVVESCGCM